MVLPGGRAIAYVVDADGRRVGREVGGTLTSGYLYDPAGRVVAVTDGPGAVVARFAYDNSGHLATMQKGIETYRIVTDSVGSPRLVIDAATGVVAEAIDYDAWGRITRDTSPGFIPFGFAGGLPTPTPPSSTSGPATTTRARAAGPRRTRSASTAEIRPCMSTRAATRSITRTRPVSIRT